MMKEFLIKFTTDRTTAEKHPKKPQKDLKKTSKNRFPLYFVWDKKPTKKPKTFRPGPELKTVFIALEMKFAMIFFSARARTENSIYSFGNEVRDDRVIFLFFSPGPELKTSFIALEMKFAMTESHFPSCNY